MEDILDDPKIHQVGADGLGWYVRILATLNRQWPKSRNGVATLSATGFSSIFDARRRDISEKRARLLAEVGLISFSLQGEDATITVRKWAETQYITTEELRRSSAETPSTTPKTKTTPKDTTSRVKPAPSEGGKKAKKPPPPEWSLWVSHLLSGLLRKRRPGAFVPKTINSWAKEIAKIEAPPATIAAAVRWLYSEANEPPYRIEVQSGRALREKFAKAHAAAERARTPTTGGKSNDPIADAARSIIERGTRKANDAHGETLRVLPGRAGGD